jgi:hypothetical protein
MKKRLKSCLRTPMLRSRTHSKLNKISEAVPNLIALKLRGVKSAKEPLTAVKFMPQMKLMVMSIKSTEENPLFVKGADVVSVMNCFFRWQFLGAML